MKNRTGKKYANEALSGVISASAAFLIWGLSPVYWKVLRTVPAFEIVMHRIIWSFLFLVLLLIITRRIGKWTSVFKRPRTVLILLTTTLIVGSNWFIFIWAVNHGHVLQSSLGYYINPLLNVFLGMVFLGEKLRPKQTVSVVLAGIGVLYLTFSSGEFPWIALSLAVLFGFYGLIRKVAPVESLEGLSVETMFLSLPALVCLFYLDTAGKGTFLRTDLKTDLFLMGAAMVTALPLLLFTRGARRLTLTSIGFLQYLTPSCHFLLAVFFYNEPFSTSQLHTFILIWLALVIYSMDSVIFHRISNSKVASDIKLENI